MSKSFREKNVRHFTWANAEGKRCLRKRRTLCYAILVVVVVAVVLFCNHESKDFAGFKGGVLMARELVTNQGDSAWLKSGPIRKASLLAKIEIDGRENKWIKEGAQAYLDNHCEVSLISVGEVRRPSALSIRWRYLKIKYFK